MGIKVGGAYRAVVEEDLMETIKDKNALLLKAKVEPFYKNLKDYPYTYVPFIGYIPPIKKGDVVWVYPMGGNAETFCLFSWDTMPDEVSSIKFNKSSIKDTDDALTFESELGSFKLTASDSEVIISCDNGVVTFGAGSTVLEAKKGTVNVKNAQGDLGSLLGDLNTTLQGLQTIGSPFTQSVSPATIAQLVQLDTQVKGVLGG